MNPFVSAATLVAGGAARATGMLGTAAFRVGSSALRSLGGGEMWTRKALEGTRLSHPYLRTGVQAGIGTLALGGALAAGAHDYTQRNRWTANSGMEIERDDFLGATGSLALALGQRRRTSSGGHNLSLSGQQRTAMLHATDDVARIFLV